MLRCQLTLRLDILHLYTLEHTNTKRLEPQLNHNDGTEKPPEGPALVKGRGAAVLNWPGATEYTQIDGEVGGRLRAQQ